MINLREGDGVILKNGQEMIVSKFGNISILYNDSFYLYLGGYKGNIHPKDYQYNIIKVYRCKDPNGLVKFADGFLFEDYLDYWTPVWSESAEITWNADGSITVDGQDYIVKPVDPPFPPPGPHPHPKLDDLPFEL